MSSGIVISVPKEVEMTKPAFAGEFEFKLTVRIFGASTVKDAKITYTYTPDWPYYDTALREEKLGNSRFGLGLLVLGNPIPRLTKAVRRSAKPRWIRCDSLLLAGVLGGMVLTQLEARIEHEVRVKDRQNRLAITLRRLAQKPQHGRILFAEVGREGVSFNGFGEGVT
jgi:hypothetical protein